jgi:NADH:ubiquinone oxidoreductase subunit 4 (subunit M)
MATVIPLAAIVIFIGVYPAPFINMVKTSLITLIGMIPG